MGGAAAVPGPNDYAVVEADLSTGNALPGSNDYGKVTITVNQNNTVGGLELSNYFNNTTTNTVNVASGATLTITGRTGDVGTGGTPFGDFVVSAESTAVLTGSVTLNRGLLMVGNDQFNGNGSDWPGSGTLIVQSGTLSLDPSSGPLGSTTEADIGSAATGAVIQGAGSGSSVSSSTVTTGNLFYIGYSGGTGTYTLLNSSILQTGSPANAIIGVGVSTNTADGSTGTLTISGASTLTLNTGSQLQVGTAATFFGTGAQGLVAQNGSGSTVQALGTASILLGATSGGTGTYQLSAGNLNIGTNVGDTASMIVGNLGTGTLTQTGGVLTVGAGSSFLVGNGGTGLYSFSAGSATFNSALTIGSTGTVTQSGLSNLVANGVVNLNAGGVYTVGGGTATLNGSLTGAGTLNVNGGKLNIATTNLNGTGAMNFGGGTLKFTSGTTYTDTFASHTLATGTTSTVDASTGAITDVTLGNITGSGGLLFNGTNGVTTFHLNGVNAINGLVGINAGTLNLSSSDLTNAASNILSVSNGAVMNLAVANGGFGYIGAITGAGTFNVNFNAAGDALVVTNTSSFSGPLVLGANGTQGTLQVFSGTYGNISDNGTASGVTIGGAALATLPGGASVPTSGTVTFGSNTYTGMTTVNQNFTLNATSLGGDLTNAGTANVQSVAGNVSNTGSFNFTNVTGNVSSLLSTGSIAATGTLTNVLNTPTATITGDLTSFGTLSVRLTGTNADFYQVNGAGGANVSGNIHLINPSGTGTYTILNASNGLTTGTLTTNAPTALFSATLTVTGTSIILNTVQTPLSTYAQTPNQMAISTALDPFTQAPPPAFAPVLAALNTLSASQIPTAIDQLGPQSLQYSSMIAFENSTFLVQKVNNALANVRAGYAGLDGSGVGYITPGMNSALGRQMNTLLASNNQPFHPAAPNGVNYYPDSAPASSNPNAPTAPIYDPSPFAGTEASGPISDSPMPLHTSSPKLRAPAFSEFIGGDVVLADLNQDNSLANAPATKANYTAGDVIAGVSLRVTSNLSMGVLFDYNHTDATTDAYGSKTTVDSYMPGVFATYTYKDFFVNGLFAFGYNTYSNSRNIPLTGSTATSSPTGQQYVGDLDFGYNFYPAKGLVVTPTLGLTYVHLDVDGFTETGGNGADLSVHSQSTDSLRSRLGGQVAYFINAGSITFQPNISAMWQHEYLNDSTGITSSFSDIGSSAFTIQTANPSRDSALLGAGVTATLNNNMALYLNYMADVGASNYFAQTVFGGFKAQF